jgi:hypothetical protein
MVEEEWLDFRLIEKIPTDIMIEGSLLENTSKALRSVKGLQTTFSKFRKGEELKGTDYQSIANLLKGVNEFFSAENTMEFYMRQSSGFHIVFPKIGDSPRSKILYPELFLPVRLGIRYSELNYSAIEFSAKPAQAIGTILAESGAPSANERIEFITEYIPDGASPTGTAAKDLAKGLASLWQERGVEDSTNRANKFVGILEKYGVDFSNRAYSALVETLGNILTFDDPYGEGGILDNFMMDKWSTGKKQQTLFGLDTGLTYRLSDKFVFAGTIRNLIPQKYEFEVKEGYFYDEETDQTLLMPLSEPERYTVKVNPQVRLGVGYSPFEWLTLSADADVNKVKAMYWDSQQVGVGASVRPFSFLTLNFGLGQDLKLDDKPRVGAGFSINAPYVRFDLGFDARLDKVTIPSAKASKKFPINGFGLALGLEVSF